jgi:hypothetical protein
MSDRLVIRLMTPGEVDTLREIDLAARSRYRSLSGFEKFADAAMPAAQIWPGLQVILRRHATFVDMTRRDTLWKQLPIVNV